jgi:3-deoxy-D-manno-octulosonate 8-phosphate phosphatase (KDO 8-P phosphatase)
VPTPNEIAAQFTALGGEFVTPPHALAERLARVRALAFDWDGVFNPGIKGGGSHSTWSEADSMGVNLLRYTLWQALGERQAVCALITGADNPAARDFAQREHFHHMYQGVVDKRQALQRLCADHGLEPDEVMYTFDDVNDLGVASMAGVRVLVRRESSPLLAEHARTARLADYITGCSPPQHALREACELMMGLLQAFSAVATARGGFTDVYRRYFAERQRIVTAF